MGKITIPISTLKSLKPMLASDNSRPALCHAWYRAGRLVGGDGFVLLTVDATSDVPEGTLIDITAILNIARVVKQARLATVTVREDGMQSVLITNSNPDYDLATELHAIDATPPDWKDVLEGAAQPKKESVSVTLDAALIGRVVNAALAQKPNGLNGPSPITFTIPNNGTNGIRFAFRGTGNEFFEGVVMPMLATSEVTRE